ncbi:MAG: glycosyltransferase family 2 [Harvfovirus sp.]|uniref:Glycosyltransferase family 2 n=1 Tax=Harvfovirus sp. TaxID=2487768 RepID=A0A3G5A4J5_9VIRU|nr:MAG: glycosyltransferase family 2 [Harvfovirus sp.]
MVKYKLCLNMIVKNESHIIRKTLDSVVQHIDYWVISDTGSKDNTQEIIKEYFREKNIKGELFEDKWENFGHNRSLAMKYAYKKSKYLLVIDADDILHGTVTIPKTNADAYYILLSSKGSTGYYRLQIFKNSLRWCYKGILHEFAKCMSKKDPVLEFIRNVCSIESLRLGSRNLDPLKYENDAKKLVKGIEEEPELADRYSFYAAQSFKDAGDFEKAITYYRKRIEYGGWFEELFISYLNIGDLMQIMNYEDNDIINSYTNAFKKNQQRAESLYELGKFYIKRGNYQKAYNTLKLCLRIPFPEDQLLFLVRDVYEYLAIKEFIFACSHLGKFEEMMDNYKKLSSINRDDNSIREIVNNYLEYKENPYKKYNRVVVDQIMKNIAENKDLMLTCTITSCKRFDLFQNTINSMMNNCLDICMISRWVCIDDNSDEADIKKMKDMYPFFEIIWKGIEDKGHLKSMNMIINLVKSPYLLHLEDDWLFIEKKNYIKPALEILNQEKIFLLEDVPSYLNKTIKQVLFNKNYSETLHRKIYGGYKAITSYGFNYIIHEHVPVKDDINYKNAVNKYNKMNCIYWPHFSFRPSIIKTDIFDIVGQFSDKGAVFFEMDFAFRYTEKNFISCFYDNINLIHMGKKTFEKNDTTKKNAYELNQTPYLCNDATKEVVQLPGYVFFENKDSVGNDIGRYAEDLVDLKEIADKDDSCVAFNTLGYLKNKLESKFISTNVGIYVKDKYCQPVELEGYMFYRNKDSYGNDIGCQRLLTVCELKELADKTKGCLGFNTWGYLKNKIEKELKFLPNRMNLCDGIYIKKDVSAK